VVEDGTDRAVGESADFDGARGGGFQTGDAERAGQPQDAEAGSEALLGVRPLLQDELAERGSCRTAARVRLNRSSVQLMLDRTAASG
jgi:hypothetical protein